MRETTIDPDVCLVALRTEDDSGLAAGAFAAPRLSWRLEGSRPDIRQRGYEIEVSGSDRFEAGATVSSGEVEAADPFLAPWPDRPLQSRERRWWRVRARTDAGLTPWSAPAAVEASLLERADWVARPICPVSNVGRREVGPAPLVRRVFRLDWAPVRARLYVTALGVWDVEINGAPVSGDVLEPGWTAYNGRLLFAAYDVTHLLSAGGNVISGVIGEGWWRGDLTWELKRAVYGESTALLAQLEVELAGGERVVIGTDSRWRGSYGAIRSAELYQGAEVDLRAEPTGWRKTGFDDGAWEAVAELPLPQHLEPRAMPAVRVLERRPLEAAADQAAGAPLRLDVGQNITGWLEIRARGPEGASLTARHAEMLDAAGGLYTAALRNARATDRYVLAGEGTHGLSPPFTFHGFRYAEIAADPGVVIEAVWAIVVATDLRPTGRFSCSDARVDRLFENAVWSQRGNFLSLPTDCPQRDERLGWTGDIQVFSPTACLNADCRAFLESWLKDLAIDQRADGAVPFVVPNVLGEWGGRAGYGAVAWGDAATVIPFVLRRAFGDTQVIARQYASMRAWVDWCAARRDEEGLWTRGFQFGDWLDPDAPPDRPNLAKVPHGIVATSYLAFSAGLVARAAALLGKGDEADRYGALQGEVAAAAWRKWRDDFPKTQTGCALAIELGIAPAGERAGVGAALAALVEANGYRIGTGFVGTPLLLPALTATGQLEAAYKVLLNPDCPGWLYQVAAGATTIWERWDAVAPDGAIHSSELTQTSRSMVSFNHYAYGAVAAWLYEVVAGLSIDLSGDREEPLRFAPRPGGGLTSARADLETPFGAAAIAWTLQGDQLSVETKVPPAATALFVPPPGFSSPRADGWVQGSGDHQVRLTRSA